MPILSEIHYELPIPDGVTVEVENGHHTTVKGPKGQLERAFRYRGVELRVENGHVVIHKDLPRREHKAICGTYAAHLNNMFIGVTKGWKYEMKVVYNHFPIKASVSGNRFVVENFLGERHPRTAEILPDVKVHVKGDHVELEGIHREHVGQTAANIEQTCRVRGRDIRVFQDGIYMTFKGKEGAQ
jgi:large subunit ribosomal protein L6